MYQYLLPVKQGLNVEKSTLKFKILFPSMYISKMGTSNAFNIQAEEGVAIC